LHPCYLVCFVPQRDRVITEAAEHYLSLAARLAREELPIGTSWRDVETYREKLVANKEYQWVNFREQKVRQAHGHWWRRGGGGVHSHGAVR
jgi:hypothetical protein